ncbi:hypothetical protein GCM10022254_36390 [Actinomadura meridiana]|uniref:Carrier domain-containing protein n=1 Tax=Actinomadura meridiana TaxID=559626 RepID=A0ABP8C4L5_9ACTN
MSGISGSEAGRLLVAVGVEITDAQCETAFEELGVDSLARAEIAARVQERFGVDIEDELREETTPADLMRFLSGVTAE